MKMIGVKATGRTGEDSDIVEFRLSEVNFITVREATKNSQQVPVYHVQENEYMQLRTMKDMTIAYQKFGFIEADRFTIINKRRVRRMVQKRTGSFVEFIDGTKISIANRRKQAESPEK